MEFVGNKKNKFEEYVLKKLPPDLRPAIVTICPNVWLRKYGYLPKRDEGEVAGIFFRKQ